MANGARPARRLSSRCQEDQTVPVPLQDHPFRRAIMDEVHARPVEIIDGPCRIRRVALMLPPVAGATARLMERFEQFAATAGISAGSSRQRSFQVGTRHVTWEFHTEFITVTWRSTLDDKQNWPDGIGLVLLDQSQLIGAMRIDIIGDSEVPPRLLPGFTLPSLCVAGLEAGAAQVVTDFVPDADGFTRFELAAGALSPLRRSIVARRLLEIETYRTMALLGLPLARQLGPQLRACEIELTALIETLSDATTTDSVQTALTALHNLSTRSGQLSEQLGYRFAAGHAYGDILRTRLAGLRELPTSLGSSLGSYVANRVDPGLATCAAMEKRLVVLADKIERAIGLLNVRIGLDLQIQNKAVLETIARTGTSQFRLQRTVEGLSTIAISYYLLGILGYLLAGPLEQLHFEKTLVMSVAAPIVLLAVWLTVRAVRRQHAGHD